jgi:hypothetical protein
VITKSHGFFAQTILIRLIYPLLIFPLHSEYKGRHLQTVSEIQQLLLTVLKAIPSVISSNTSSSDGKPWIRCFISD